MGSEPSALQFLINIGGAAALLIWAVRLVRTGVERAFSNQLRRWMRSSADNRFLASASGLGTAVLLQSSTAVAVLTTGFVARNGLAAGAALAILLGADVGSAVVSQLLLLRPTVLAPLLILAGVTLFLRSERSEFKQTGKIFIGLALIFISLDMISQTSGPIAQSAGARSVLTYLNRDALTAFIVGAVLAWAFHSSVAAVLLFVTLAAQSVMPINAAAALVLGANLGGACIAYGLSLAAPMTARRVVIANLVLRGGGATLAVAVLSIMPEVLVHLGETPGLQAINLHLMFNGALLIIAFPFVGLVMRATTALTPDRSAHASILEETSALDPAALDRPTRALDCAARELLVMGQKVERILLAIEPLYKQWDPIEARVLKEQDKAIRAVHLDVKLYLARVGVHELDENLSQRSMDLAAISASLVSASDTVARTMLNLAKRLNKEGVEFSAEGSSEISNFTDRVTSNVQLALNVMLNQNPAEARELVAAKDKVREVEQRLQKQHLNRLMQGKIASIETSNLHQETLRALKQINTAYTMIGYPILAKSGDLLASRLAFLQR